MNNTVKILSRFKMSTFFYLLLLFIMNALWIVNMFFTNKLFESLFFVKSDYFKYLIIFIGLIGLRIIISITNLVFSKSFKLKINNYIRQESLKRILKGNAHQESTDATISKILSNVNLVTEKRIFIFFEIISNFLCLVFAISLLIYYHWSYAVLVSFLAITLSLLPMLYKNKYNKYQKEITAIDNNYKGEIGTLINQRNSMYLLSKLNVVNNLAAKLTLEKNKNSYKVYKRMMITFSPNVIFGLISQIFAPILSAILAYYGLVSITLIGISSYIFGTALSTLIVLPETIKNFASSKSVMDDLFSINSPKKIEYISKIQINEINPIINGKELFSAPLSFAINNNTKLNIIGKNGSGKSSLLNIFKGELSTFNGNFIVNGLQNPMLLGQSDVVFLGEKPFIFNGTIRDNISLFNKNIKDVSIIKSLEDVHLKLKLNDVVANDTLSDGQKQKISIARAFVYNPNILFLDETLNNVDIQSKIAIENQLLAKNMAVIIISHKGVSNEFKKIKIN